MRRFANSPLFVSLDAGCREGRETGKLSDVFEEFVSAVLQEFIKEPDRLVFYQSLVFCQYKLLITEASLAAKGNDDICTMSVLKNASSFLKNQRRFLEGLLLNEGSIRSIERIPKQSRANKAIKWTKSKTDLVELAYAAIANESFNNGNIEVKELINYFSEAFEVPMDNYYETYVQIRRRKGSRTSFLDDMIKNLIVKMDETDNKDVRGTR